VWQIAVGTIPQPFAEHAVYWAGPMVGAMAACVFYSTVLRPPEKK